MLKINCTKPAKKFLYFFLLTYLIGYSLSAQTYVSGGIYSNTTWTKVKSPYIVTDTVKVFPGVTLTIQPGVTVKFNDTALLEDYGNLNAIGTITDSIIFTSNNLTPYAGIWNGLQIYSDTESFRYCRFSYANSAVNAMTGLGYNPPIARCLFNSDLNGINNWPNGNIDTCIFKYDTVGINNPFYGTIISCKFLENGQGLQNGQDNLLYCSFTKNTYGVAGEGNSSISYCTFDSNSIGIYAVDDTISNCSIKYNGVGINSLYNTIVQNDISDNMIGIETYDDPTISCNSICSNTKYNIVAEMPTNESVSNNYWCLPDSIHIQPTIYDAYQNFNLGFAYFTPFDKVVCTHICNLSVSATATLPVVCAGDTTTLTANVTDNNPVYTAIWTPGNHKGLYFTVKPLAKTTYTVVVTDSSGCKDSTTITIDTSCAPHHCNLFVFASGYPLTVCQGDSAVLSAYITDSAHVKNVVWNPGNYHGNSITVTPHSNTTYTLTVTDSIGCKDSAFVTIDTMRCIPPPCGNAYPPPICYVTTDTSSAFNRVVWQKTGMDTLAIDSVIIYRQNILNTFVRIGEVSVHAHTEFKDYGARPLIEPSFYELGIHDTCGMDSNANYYNETIFLQSSAGLGPNEANLNWNFYVGSPVVYYRILRDDSGKGIWHAIDSVQGAINAYTDRSAPINKGLRYMISTDWNVVCTPYLSMQFKRYVFSPTGSYSNMSYLYPTGIAAIFNDNAVSIYPNPATNVLSVTFTESFKGAVRINNVLGQEVYNNTQFTADKGNTGQVNISNLPNGVYIVTFLSDNGASVRKKIIKD